LRSLHCTHRIRACRSDLNLAFWKKDRDRELVFDRQLTQSSDDVGYLL